VKHRESMTWSVAPGDPASERRLSASLGLCPLTARLLRNRRLQGPEESARFLHPRLEDLHDPFLLTDMDAAVARVHEALREGEKIVVLGDFDADGVTATSLLVRLFRIFHADVSYFIPDRLEEGYGLHEDAVERLAAGGAKLLITVDCGITALRPVARARALGLDVIVTDHHEPAPAMPACTAVLNPKREGETYPFRDLAGVGVAFKLAWALARDVSPSREVTEDLKVFLWESMGLVALGTVADVVPLRGENRILVKHGLRALGATRHPGERALMEVSVKGKPDVTDLAFRMGPRINAAGRLGDSRKGVELFTCESFEDALETASELDRMNRRRQTIEKRIFEQARDCVLADGLDEAPAIVLASPAWHAGVIGIVASRLVESFRRPVVMFRMEGEIGRGSARSIPALHLHRSLGLCADTLEAFGGHAQAAGLTIRSDQFETFRAAFLDVVEDALEPDDLTERLEVEAEVSLSAIDNALLAELALLEPFGAGNPEPVLAVKDGFIAGKPRRMGSKGEHLSFFFREGDAAFRAVAFGLGERARDLEKARADLAFTPVVNRFRGREKVELRVKDIRVTGTR